MLVKIKMFLNFHSFVEKEWIDGVIDKKKEKEKLENKSISKEKSVTLKIHLVTFNMIFHISHQWIKMQNVANRSSTNLKTRTSECPKIHACNNLKILHFQNSKSENPKISKSKSSKFKITVI